MPFTSFLLSATNTIFPLFFHLFVMLDSLSTINFIGLVLQLSRQRDARAKGKKLSPLWEWISLFELLLIAGNYAFGSSLTAYMGVYTLPFVIHGLMFLEDLILSLVQAAKATAGKNILSPADFDDTDAGHFIETMERLSILTSNEEGLPGAERDRPEGFIIEGSTAANGDPILTRRQADLPRPTKVSPLTSILLGVGADGNALRRRLVRRGETHLLSTGATTAGPSPASHTDGLAMLIDLLTGHEAVQLIRDTWT
jgi:hypothetical protein